MCLQWSKLSFFHERGLFGHLCEVLNELVSLIHCEVETITHIPQQTTPIFKSLLKCQNDVLGNFTLYHAQVIAKCIYSTPSKLYNIRMKNESHNHILQLFGYSKMWNTWHFHPNPKAGKRGGGKFLKPRLVRGFQNLGKTSGHGCDCQEGWWLVVCNYLLVLGPNPGSHKPCQTHSTSLENVKRGDKIHSVLS